LFPRYGNANLTSVYDSALGTHSAYSGAVNPAYGLDTTNYQDLFGVALPTMTAYESPGVSGSFLRPLAKRLPAATQITTVKDDSPSLYWRLGDLFGPTAADGSGNN